MKKVKIVLAAIIISLCAQPLMAVNAFADTDATVPATAEATQPVATEATQPVKATQATSNTTAAPKAAQAAAAPTMSLEKYIETELDKYSTRIDISAYNMTSKDKVRAAWNNVIKNNARLFFVSDDRNLGVTSSKVTSLLPTYIMKGAEADKAKASFDTAVNKALKAVNNSMSDIEKAKAIHDYLIKNAEYDYANYKKGTVPAISFRAYGVLVKKVGVCQSYATAYKYIMQNKLGIQCGFADTDTHVWNIIKVNGTYYNVDATWDDAGSKISTKYFLAGKKTMAAAHSGKSISYDYSTSSVDYGTPSAVAMKSVKPGKKQATANWKSTSASGYQVYYSAKKSSGFQKAKTVSNAKTVKFTKKGLKKGKTYYFKVRAYKVVNGKTVYGSFSSVKKVKVK